MWLVQPQQTIKQTIKHYESLFYNCNMMILSSVIFRWNHNELVLNVCNDSTAGVKTFQVRNTAPKFTELKHNNKFPQSLVSVRRIWASRTLTIKVPRVKNLVLMKVPVCPGQICWPLQTLLFDTMRYLLVIYWNCSVKRHLAAFYHTTPYILSHHTLHSITPHPTFYHTTPYIRPHHTLHL
jgi:hypothetical protein